MRLRGGQCPQGKVAGIEQACGMVCVVMMMGVLMSVVVMQAGRMADGRKQQERQIYGDRAKDTESPPTRLTVPPTNDPSLTSHANATAYHQALA
jgi:hypothetical protein